MRINSAPALASTKPLGGCVAIAPKLTDTVTSADMVAARRKELAK